jgi:hypothetical protein
MSYRPRRLAIELLESRALLAADFGDAPAPYPAASHEELGPTLGALRDTEAVSQPTASADGDGADDDGVTFGAVRAGQLGAAVIVNVQNAPAGAKLDAWIDFNGDGNWGGPGEHIFASRVVTAGDNALAFDVPASAAQGTTFARFRLSTAGALGVGGVALDGEVEDYAVAINGPLNAGGQFSSEQIILGDSPFVLANPRIIVPADLDGDGDLDVVYNGNQLAWFENLGAGLLSLRQLSTSTLATTSLVVDDLDGDADFDIIYSLGNSITWRENDGTDLFPAHTIASGLTSLRGITVADLDGDGDRDVAAVSEGTARAAWFENNGAETFASHTINTTLATPNRLAAADMDRDGDLDLLVVGSALSWLENDGSQTFTARTVTSSVVPTSAIPVDVDRDGDLDIAAAAGSTLLWYENNGVQVFTARTIANSIGSTALITGAADIDGDGDVDLTATTNGRVAWYANNGTQVFTANLLTTFDGATFVAPVDVNGDGALDLLSIHASSPSGGNKIVWRHQLVPGDFGDAPAPYPTALAANGPRHLAGGPQLGASRDSEADGFPSINADGEGVDDDGIVWSVLQAGQLGATLTATVQNAPAGAKLDAWIDFNGDGSWGGADEQILASAAVANGVNLLQFNVPATGAVGATYARVRLSTAGNLGIVGSAPDGEVEDYPVTIKPPALASGVFAGPHAIHTGTSIPAVHAADLDADGDMDVVAIYTSPAVTIRLAWFENNGGAYVEHAIGNPVYGAATSSLEVADLDGDGDLDVIAAASYEAIRWFENDGNENFTGRITNAYVATPDLLSAMDVNGDGHLDLVTTRRVNGEGWPEAMVWHENDGHQQFTERSIGTPASMFNAVTAADFDGNGILDFLGSGNDLEIFPNPGPSGYSTAAAVLLLQPQATAPLVADMDTDGDLDIVVVSANAGAVFVGTPSVPVGSSSVIVLRNNGSGAFTLNYVGYITTPTFLGAALTRPIALADVEGDGDIDVLGPGVWMDNIDGVSFAKRPGPVLPAAHTNLFAADMDGDGDLDALASTGGSLVWFENRSVTDVDFGDAAASYGVLLASGGAFHGGGGPQLGATRDAEADGAPSVLADADAGDDGVTFGALRVGDVAATVTVNVQNAPVGARLSAWIDFNGDGVWAPSEEQILAGALVTEGNNQITFAIPSTAVTTSTVARFRLSTAAKLGPGGAALDGEVEDYAVELTPPASAENLALIPLSPIIARTADIDGDGDLDLLGRGTNQSLNWSENLGQGSYLGHYVSIGAGAPATLTDLQPADYDRDGDVDVVVASSQGVGWYENNGAETFAYRPITTTPSVAAIAVVDVDGDGAFDIVPTFAGSSPALVWYRNEGGYTSTRQTVASPITFYSSIRAADMDRDGDVDFVVGAATGSDGIHWLRNDGSGAFTSLSQVTSSTTVDALAVVDLDRDGDFDIVSQFNQAGTRKFEWLENTGDDSFWRHSIGSTMLSPSSIDRLAVVDLDGDDDFDLVLSEGDYLRLYRNDGMQVFTVSDIATATANGPKFSFVHAADLNDDGDLELLTSTGVLESWAANEAPIPFHGGGNFSLGPGISDEVVDGNDFLAWQRNLGLSAPSSNAVRADWDRSGVVDAGDLEIWKRNYGAGVIRDDAWFFSPPAEPAVVPASEATSASAVVASAVPDAEPILAPSLASNVILTPTFDGKGTDETKQVAVRRPSFRPVAPHVAARDAALAMLPALREVSLPGVGDEQDETSEPAFRGAAGLSSDFSRRGVGEGF